MSTEQVADKKIPDQSTWRRAVRKYERPDLKRSLWQVANSVIPYAVLWWLMILSLDVSYWLTALLAFPAAGFMVRTFIISHDCGHGSFFKSHRANDFVGFFTGVLTFTPYQAWRRDHAIHHATSGDLDRRGLGDVWTLTVEEYQQGSWWLKFRYRLFRNPIVLFFFSAPFLFLIWHRVPSPGSRRREILSVVWTNLALVAIVVTMGFAVGLREYLIVQGTIMIIGAPVGVWLFYVQHQFEETYWEHHPDWEYIPACLQGSSFYKLPKVLQWFSGNIGFHHIHHLSPRVPNYFLERCHKENPGLLVGEPLTLLRSLKSLRFRLWDEEQGRMISFADLRRREAQAA